MIDELNRNVREHELRSKIADARDASTRVKRIRCAEIWGGVQNADLEACTSGIRASLYSSACDGGRGGDVYYFSVCRSDVLTRVALADVTGHGERVSRVSQWLYDSLTARMNTQHGHTVLSDLNRQAEKIGEAAISTAAVIGFYRSTGRLYFSYAGHPPAMYYRRNERNWRPLELPDTSGLANLPIGVTELTRFDQGQMRIRRGDRLFLYTDGVIEAPDEAGSLFGAERLLNVLQQTSDDPLPAVKEAVLSAVRAHTGGPMNHDDVTVLALEIGG
jgi:sigma-B regulation protein RsbU (phosphoserine phosphatase)